MAETPGQLVPAPQRARNDPHDWHELDATHRECRRCKLRIFLHHNGHRYTHWTTLDHNGVPGGALLDGAGGVCEAPAPAPVSEELIIEYTGHPDRFPACERIMHRIELAKRNALVARDQVRPKCKKRFTWWELGPARAHLGWTWCKQCWPQQAREQQSTPEWKKKMKAVRGELELDPFGAETGRVIRKRRAKK